MNRRRIKTVNPNEPNQRKGDMAMDKKRNKPKNMVFGAIITALLMLAMVFPVSADEEKGIYSEGEPAEAAITKIFKMPVNTTIPEAVFVFDFEPVGVNDKFVDSENNSDIMPAMEFITIEFNNDEDEEADIFYDGDTKYVIKQGIINTNITGKENWKMGEGIYIYKLTENHDKSEIIWDDNSREWSVFSEAEYIVEFWVEENDKGILYPKFIVVRIVEDHEDDYYDGIYSDVEEEDKTAIGKVDPTPGSGGAKKSDEIDAKYSQVIFTNIYWKTDGEGLDELEKNSLEIEKMVIGMGADFNAPFKFTVTVTQPSVIPTDEIPKQTYKVVVLDADGKEITSETKYEPLVNDRYIEIKSEEPLTINLTHGQKLVFVDLHVGAVVEAYEWARDEKDGSYIPSYRRTFANENDNNLEEDYTGVMNSEFGFPREGEEHDPGPHYLEEGAGHNKATFTNRRTNATPTGISVDDLPYIVLINLAVIGLILFVIVKYRKKNARETIQL